MTVIKFYNFMQPPVMTVNGGATVTLAECDFIDNTSGIRNDTSEYFASEQATIAQSRDTIIRLQDCTFPDADYAVDLSTDLTSENQPSGEVLVISDPYDDNLTVRHIVVYEDFYDNVTVYSTVDASTGPAERRGIDSTSTWLQRVKKVCHHFASPVATLNDKS
jgi:hypothetical protein